MLNFSLPISFRLCVLALGATLTGLFAAHAAAATFKTLYTFCSKANCADGATPVFGVIEDGGTGTLYGVTTAGGKTTDAGVIYALNPKAKGGYTYQLLYGFCRKATCADGQAPSSPLIRDANGNLYGATASGGPFGHGLIFELIPNADRSKWTRVTLYAFCPSNVTPCVDGDSPFGALTYAGAQTGALYDGTSALYGVTQSGGAGTAKPNQGVLFRLTSTQGKLRRKEKVLYTFCSQTDCADGSGPFGLTIDANGILYGPTQYGGHPTPDDGGVVYQFAPKTLTQTILYTFCSFPYFGTDCADGNQPTTPLEWDAQGRLYGATINGGGNNGGTAPLGVGVLFRLTPNGSKTREEVLYTFCRLANCTDGAVPYGGITIAPDGTIYGTTAVGNKYSGLNCGNANLGCGTLFQLKNGAYKVLHQFCPTGPVSCADGAIPYFSNLSIDQSGSVFGTTATGGADSGGTIFEYTP